MTYYEFLFQMKKQWNYQPNAKKLMQYDGR